VSSFFGAGKVVNYCQPNTRHQTYEALTLAL